MEALVRSAEPWATLYGDSPLLQTVVLFAHLAGMLIGGGLALAADRSTLRIREEGSSPEAVRQLSELDALHRPVLIALAATLVSGLMMLVADLEAYLLSAVFWIKMGMVALLLANGAFLRSTARSLSQEPNGAWSRLRTSSIASSVLWVALVLAGVLLTSFS